MILGEPPCERCSEYHDLSAVAAAECRRGRIVAEHALETSRMIDERLRRISEQRGDAMR